MECMDDAAGPGAKVLAGGDWTEETALKRRRAGVAMRRWEMRRRWAWRGGGMAAAGGKVIRRTPVCVGFGEIADECGGRLRIWDWGLSGMRPVDC